MSTRSGYEQGVICLYETHVWCNGLDDVEEVLRPSDIYTNSQVGFFRVHASKQSPSSGICVFFCAILVALKMGG